MYTPAQFTANMREFGDPTYDNFTSWPKSSSDAAYKWADLMDNCISTLVPLVLPAVRVTAKQALVTQLTSFFAAGMGVQGIPTALQLYAANLALGMAPAFIGVPPPVPLDISPLLAIQHQNPSAERSMGVMGLLVTNWLRTGTATNTATGVLLTWQ
jgi:hypothetical protein